MKSKLQDIITRNSHNCVYFLQVSGHLIAMVRLSLTNETVAMSFLKNYFRSFNESQWGPKEIQ